MLLPLCKDTNIIDTLIRKFYRGSLDYDIKPEDLLEINWNKQEEFLNATVNHKLIKKYPVRSEFARLFFKKLISYFEKSLEVHDDLYENLCKVMKSSNEDFCYRHYIIGDGLNNIITLKETNNMVVNGTTGLRTWEAAKMLADWALSNQNIFRNKKILELGSGVGFTGITIARFCQPKNILLTDCHEDVLSNIVANIEINFPMFRRHEPSNTILFEGQDQTLEVMNLDWNDIDNLSIELCPDIIVGSDIIYDPTIITPLCNIINFFCNKNKNVEVFIAGIIRHEETLRMFLDKIREMNLHCVSAEQSDNVFIEWDIKLQRYLLKINQHI